MPPEKESRPDGNPDGQNPTSAEDKPTGRIGRALALAGWGYGVLPVKVFKPRGETKFTKRPPRGLKGPDGKGGVRLATTDPDTIRRYWNTKYVSANGNPTDTKLCYIAVVPPLGVIIVGDDGQVFDEVWADRPYVESPSGGRHYYFRIDPFLAAELQSHNEILYTEDPEGIVDIRVGGEDPAPYYIVTASGAKYYKERNGFTADPERLPELPDDVFARLATAPRKERSGDGSAGPGGRNSPGLDGVPVGNAYDGRDGVAEEWLEKLGWTDEGDRWIRPGGTDGAAKVALVGDVWFVNVHTHNDDVLKGGHFYTASMLRCIAEFGGDWFKTYFALSDEDALFPEEGFDD